MIVKKLAILRTLADRRTFVEERQEFVTLMQTVSFDTQAPAFFDLKVHQHAMSVLRWLRGNREQRCTEEDSAREDRKTA